MDLDAGQTSHALVGLQPNTDYVVMVAPLFRQLEGPTATVRQRTGRCWVQVMPSCCCAWKEAGISPPSPCPAMCGAAWLAAEWHKVAWPMGSLLQRQVQTRRYRPTSWAPHPSRCSGPVPVMLVATVWSGREPQVGMGCLLPLWAHHASSWL